MNGWRSYVAIGDSFTEGLDDPRPDGLGYRGWADLVAGRLAAEHRATTRGRSRADEEPHFRYANLAVRGRLFDPIVAEQVPLAMTMRPALVSFAAGGNDVLRRSFDPDALVRRFDDTIAALRGTGADVLLFRFADVTTQLPGKRLILPRVRLLNQAVGEVAARHGARLVDLWRDAEFHNPLLWSDDRLHLSSYGHRRVAAHVLAVLGLEADPAWRESPARPLPRSWPAARAADARWARQHLAPWVKRRMTGKSSGDALTPKRPTLAPFTE